MSGRISFRGFAGTGVNSSTGPFVSKQRNFPSGLSLSDIETYDACDKTVNFDQSLAPESCDTDFVFGYDLVMDRIQFVHLTEAYAKDGKKISDNIVFLGVLNPDEDAGEIAKGLLKLHCKMLREPVSGEEVGSKEDRETPLEMEYLRLAVELKKAREVQLKEKATESANSQMGKTSGTMGHV